MDNLTHSLVGWALGRTGLKDKTRKGLAALILAANMPDIDVFFGWVGWAPLATHRGFTHGLVGGVIVMPPLLAGLLLLLDRWQAARGSGFADGLPMRVGWLVLLAYLGALTHPLLDLQTTYAVQLLAPFSTTWFHTETLFIIDVWIWIGLAFAIWLSRRRERAGRESWRRPAMAGLVVLCLYIGLNGAISLAARAALWRAVRPEVAFANEEPLSFWKRSLVWRAHGRIGRASYDPVHGLHAWRVPVPDQMQAPLVRRAMMATPDMVRFMRWSTLPMARVISHGCTATVMFSDARFGDPQPGNHFLREVTLQAPGPGCPDHPAAERKSTLSLR